MGLCVDDTVFEKTGSISLRSTIKGLASWGDALTKCDGTGISRARTWEIRSRDDFYSGAFSCGGAGYNCPYG
jgi:hypothetical protein